MQHLLISVSDSTNLNALNTSIMKHKGVERVQTVENDEKSVATVEHNWKNRLHLPGPPLNDKQLEELLQDMEAETKFFTLEEAKAITLQNLAEWKQNIHSK
jgi:hypothetical protein